ncbi:MAG: O-antigen ligase family protein [Chloroflexia bacterium]
MILNSRLQDNTLLRQIALALLAVGLGAAGGLAIVAGNPLIPFVAVAALVALPWLVARPHVDLVLVAATITLLPYAALPVRLAVLTPTLLEVALAMLYVAWLLRALTGAQGGLVRTPLDVPLLLFLGATAFAFVLGLGRDAGTDIAHNYLKLLLAIGIFFAATHLLHDTGSIALVLRSLILIGGAQAALGVLLWRLPDALTTSLLSRLSVVGYPTDRVVRYIEDNPALGERAVGTQVDPNSFGGLLVVIAVLTGVAFLSRKPLLPRWLLGGLLLVDITALVLTNSRSALLGVVAAGVLVATMRYRRLWGWGLALGALLLVFGLGSGYFARLALGLRFEDQASLMRLAEYSNALDIIGRYPAFGVGFGTAGELDLTTGVSSIYLTIAERTGLLGLGLFVAAIVTFFLVAIPAIRRSGADGGRWTMDDGQLLKDNKVERTDEQPSSTVHRPPSTVSPAQWSILDTALLGGTASIVGALVVGIVDHYYFNIEFPHMAALLWLTAGTALAARRLLIEPRGMPTGT